MSRAKAKVMKWPWDVIKMNAGELLKEVEVRSQKLEARRQKCRRGRKPCVAD
jgi:hypothetical protein